MVVVLLVVFMCFFVFLFICSLDRFNWSYGSCLPARLFSLILIVYYGVFN